MAFQGGGFSGGGSYYLGKAELLAVNLGNSCGEVNGMNWLDRRIVKQPMGIKKATFVEKVRFLSLENELPNAESLSQGKAGSADWRKGPGLGRAGAHRGDGPECLRQGWGKFFRG